MNYPILWKLDKKISLATQLRTDLHSSGSYMQVTNYGVGGMCDAHIDPKGIMEMKHVEPDMLVTGNYGSNFYRIWIFAKNDKF